MRKFQKQQAVEVIAAIEKSHESFRRRLEAGDSTGAMEELAVCQGDAIGLGNLIEETEGEECRAVHLTEEYCELVYQLYKAVESGQELKPSQAIRKMKKFLIRLENAIKYEIKQRIEAVFLPYKASMWDSLESVWQAADADTECNAYVIPIPYYDKNPDGSVREMHYEGGQYPEYVPITDYRVYEFDKRRPDYIFIHNPYDNTNFITSVNPFFYSSNLKKYTDCLVYIPYFILEEGDSNHRFKLIDVEDFCFAPGVFQADKVILQSEKMKASYRKALTKVSRDQEEAQKYWENKLSGIGSPKEDKIAGRGKGELTIPSEWMEIIRRKDGSWKNIVFYNTSIGTLLQYNEQMLNKMRDVFRFFQDNQDTMALLWRPHPLMKATIESMRPQLKKEYTKIVEEYREDGWGIYDESADLDRAIILSDLYYGDWSSVVPLVKKAKKISIIQNVRKTVQKTAENKLYEMLSASSCAVLDKKLLFYTRLGDLAELNLETGKLDYIPNKTDDLDTRSVFQIENKFYRLDNESAKITDIASGVEFYLEEAAESSAHIRFAEKYNSFLYVLYGDGLLFLEIDVNNKSYRHMNLKKKLEDSADLKKVDCSFRYGGLHENKIYIQENENGYILCYELDADRWEIYRPPSKIGSIQHIACKGDMIFLLNYKNEIYRWFPQDERIELIWSSEQYQNTKQYFGRIHICKDRLILLPWRNGSDIVFLDYKKGRADLYEDYPKGFGYVLNDLYKYVIYTETEQAVYYPMRSSNYFLCISKETGTLNWIKPIMPDKELVLKKFKSSCSKKRIQTEIAPLNDYISAVNKGEGKDKKDPCVGEKIWREIKG